MSSLVTTRRTALSGEFPGACGFGRLTCPRASDETPNKATAAKPTLILTIVFMEPPCAPINHSGRRGVNRRRAAAANCHRNQLLDTDPLAGGPEQLGRVRRE